MKVHPFLRAALGFIALGGMLTAPGLRAAETIPPKTVVLTFDDAVASHLDMVAPRLKELGFGATFFITHAWMNDREHFLTWEQVGRLHALGFEIGNHSWTHAGFESPRMAARLAGELALVENELAKVGVPKPVSFGWTGNNFGPEAVAVLARAGYRLARRGMQPEAPYGSLELGPLFDPQRHHALLIPSAGDAYPNWTLAQFKQVVDRAVAGRAAIVQFHGVPDVAHPWVHTPVERFREYTDYLKQGGFHVIALRDLLPYLPEQPVKDDPMLRTQYPAHADVDQQMPTETTQTLARLDAWLPNLVLDHRYTLDEVRLVTGLSRGALEPRIAALQAAPPAAAPAGCIKIRPYPGGRHPRIGFLDGAIDPQRGTKVSLFPPWPDGGYVVLDLPEAIFSQLGLLFLAHTHVPTVWNDQNVTIENQDWREEPDGRLTSAWRLPNGVAFGAEVIARPAGGDFVLWLENGSTNALTGLRTQVCLMLKGAPGFNEQNQERKQYEKPLVVVRAQEGDRFLLLGFTHCIRTWGGEKCPCVHSDPVFPDAAPGQRVTVQGRLRFHTGPDVAAAKQRLLDELHALSPP